MKRFTCLVFVLIALKSFSQKTETYYDYDWKPCEPLKARFYSLVEKTDSGYLRLDYFLGNKQLQMKALFEDSACNIHNGNAIFFHANGKVSKIGRMVHNKKEGICLSFYSNGVMSDSANYHNNKPIDYELKWHRNGYLSDSIAHINDSMDVHISWFDNGQPESAGYLLHGKAYGKWQFFRRDGTMAAAEVYSHGNLVSKKYYDETGTKQVDTTKNKPAEFKGGLTGWRRYLENNLYWPAGYKLIMETWLLLLLRLL